MRSKELPHGINGSKTMGNRIFDFFRQLSIGLVVSIGLENRIPAEISAASWLNNPPWCAADEKPRLFQLRTHIGDYAHRVSSFIRERLYHFGQSFRSHAFEEPLDIGPG